MFSKYVKAAMASAAFEVMEEEAGVFGTIPLFDGLWAEGVTREECAAQLEERLEEWLVLSLQKGLPIPVVAGIDLVAREVA